MPISLTSGKFQIFLDKLKLKKPENLRFSGFSYSPALIALFLNFFFIACGNSLRPSPSPPQQLLSCIRGGQPAFPSGPNCQPPLGPWDSVVAIKSESGDLCSGVLIHPQIVLTAAHCLPSDTSLLNQLERTHLVYLGPGEDEVKFHGQYKVLKGRRYPFYRKDQQGLGDFAYLFLKEPIPSAKIYPILWEYPEVGRVLQPGQKVLVVGYGQRDSDHPKKVGKKFFLETHLQQNNFSEFLIEEREKGICSGDSGGPAFIRSNKGWKLLGIASRGPGECRGGRGIYGLAYQTLCWIQAETEVDLGDGGFHCYQPALSPNNIHAESTEEGRKEFFLSLCHSPQTPLSQRHTFFILQQQMQMLTGNLGPSCEDLYGFWRKQKELDLRKTFLHDLSPLSPFTNLQKIYLQNNQITSLSPLRHFPEIFLSLDFNPQLSVTEIKKFLQCLGEKPCQHSIHFEVATLFALAQAGNLELFHFILTLNPDLNLDLLKDSEGSNLLHWATLRGHKDVVYYLLQSEELPPSILRPSVNSQNNFGQTALMYAVKSSHWDLIGRLCQKGANPYLKNKKGESAITMAATLLMRDYLFESCQNFDK